MTYDCIDHFLYDYIRQFLLHLHIAGEMLSYLPSAVNAIVLPFRLECSFGKGTRNGPRFCSEWMELRQYFLIILLFCVWSFMFHGLLMLLCYIACGLNFFLK